MKAFCKIMEYGYGCKLLVMICSGPTAYYVCRCKTCVPDHLFVMQTDKFTSLYVVKIIQVSTLTRK